MKPYATRAKRKSISIFFPCYNDAGTIASMVELATHTAKKLTRDFEIIVVDDGSTDASRQILKELSTKNRFLKVIMHRKNKGYGGALISGFRASQKEFVFYTDGDFQYDVGELENLYALLTPNVDMVQGYKVKRHDPWYRIVIGDIYNLLVHLMFDIKIRDVDCDFRLIRKAILDQITLTHESGVITVELVKKIQNTNCRIIEAPVSHFYRSYGRSQIFMFGRLIKVFRELLELWQELVL